MLRDTRHEQLLRLLREEGVLPVGQIAQRLGVSEATARRDLNDLGNAGLLTRVYGGAVARGPVERPFAEEDVDDREDKDAIARRAAATVEDGEVVLLDIGTTVLQLARRLHGRAITVVTSNLAVYEELKDDPEVALVLLGGQVRRNYRSLVGNLTRSSLSQLYADRLFLGTSGVLPDGRVLDTTDVEVPVKQAMLGSARHVALLATARKFPGTGTARICGPGDIDALITNRTSDPATLALFRDAGVEVETAGDTTAEASAAAETRPVGMTSAETTAAEAEAEMEGR
jgi:DeoR family transcriptional regulator, fructose operon transcriptional repressor